MPLTIILAGLEQGKMHDALQKGVQLVDQRVLTRVDELIAKGEAVARYEIPIDAGITWKETLGPGHYDVRGDKETLKRCLTDYIVPI